MARPRALSVKLLNALYDGHDWCVSSPLDPIVTSTGERFTVDVWTLQPLAGAQGGASATPPSAASGQRSGEGPDSPASVGGIPETFRFLVCGPPFDPAGTVAAMTAGPAAQHEHEGGHEGLGLDALRMGAPESIITMHEATLLGTEDIWVPAVRGSPPGGPGSLPLEAAMASLALNGRRAGEGEGPAAPEAEQGQQYMKVTATKVRLSLAPFPRCGFYDWRLVVVTHEGAVRPATCVQPLNHIEVASAVAAGHLPQAALNAGAVGSLSPRVMPSASPRPGRPGHHHHSGAPTASGLLPVTGLAQGRCIVHRATLQDEHFHETVVDLEGMTFAEDGEIVSHGTFASLAAGLRTLRAQGVTSLIVVGAMERDNGWGEREPEASASNTPAGQVVPGQRAGRTDSEPQFPANSLAGFAWPMGPGQTAITGSLAMGMDRYGSMGMGMGMGGGDRVSDSGSEFGFIELGGETLQANGAGGLGAQGFIPGSASDGRAVTFATPVPAFPALPSGLPGDALPAGSRAYAMRPDANLHAVVDRITPNRMLGGSMGFLHLVRAASALGMRVVVQAEATTSASRPHRKYRDLYCHTLDTRGQSQVHAGTDTCENQWEDQQLLNYRKVETWELLISEAKTLVQNYHIGGLYLPDAQSYPFIMALDTGELWRRDVDGEGHYSPREIVEGAVVVSNSEVGYWSTKAAKSYPNPLLVKLVRAMWQVDPLFAVIGESHWGRAGALARSGVVPHGLDVVSAVSSSLGRFVDKMGAVKSFSLPGDIGPVHYLRALLLGEEQGLLPPQAGPHARDAIGDGRFPHPLKLLLPSPAGPMPREAYKVQLRSICSTRLPYPALLLGRSAWTAVDLMYTLPGMPCTFGEEVIGRAYRVDLAGTYAPNAAYLEEEKKKREKRLQAEKHNKKFWERSGMFGAGMGPNGHHRTSTAGGSNGTGMGMGNVLVSRPSMLHLALAGTGEWIKNGGASFNADGWEGSSGQDSAVHVGAGGVVPAALPPSMQGKGQGQGGLQRGGTGFSHMNLHELGAVAAGIATGAGRPAAGGHRPSFSAGVPGPLSALPPPVPYQSSRALGMGARSMSASSPALNMLLQGGGGLGGAEELGLLEGPSSLLSLPWGNTPTHGQHTVPLLGVDTLGHAADASTGAPHHPHAVPLAAMAAEAQGTAGEEDEDDQEASGDDVLVPLANSSTGSGASSARFGFSMAGTVGQGHTRSHGVLTTRGRHAQPPSIPGMGAVTVQVDHAEVAKKKKAEVPKVQSWVPQAGLSVFQEGVGGGWHLGRPKEAGGGGLAGMRSLEDKLRYEVGPEYGFDLAKIAGHYEHRRAVRARYPVFRDGDMQVLLARHRFGEHGHVFTYARTLPGHVAVVALNFNGHPSTFAVDTTPLAPLFGATTTADASASVQQLITSSLHYGEVLRTKLGTEGTPVPVVTGAGLSLAVTSATLPSLNLRGGVWEVRNVFEADLLQPATSGGASVLSGSGEAGGARVINGSAVTTGAAGSFTDADGPLVAILASDEAAYAPTMTTLAPHRSYCWLYVACGGGVSGRGGGLPRTPTLGSPAVSGWDKDAEVSPAAMQWLFASSILRLQAMLRLKETGLASFVVKVQEVEAAGGYHTLLGRRQAGVGEPWVSPGEMLKDEEVQAGVRHNLVYSLLRGVVKRTYKALIGARRAAADAGEDGEGGPVGTAKMKDVVQHCAESLEAALRVVVTHLKLAEGPIDPTPDPSGRRGPPTLLADPLPPLHGAMHGSAAAAPRPSDKPVDPHASWYGVDPEVGAVILRSALFLAVKDVVAQATQGQAQQQQAEEAQSPAQQQGGPTPSPVAGPGPSDVSDEDATLSALLEKGLVRVARGLVSGMAAAAYSDKMRTGTEASEGPLAAAINKEMAVMAFARRLLWRNHLGPIVFVTPELGKWSTVGGLGVMVDELSVGLAELGAEVICISPYYHLNRKGVADYLAADGIQYTSRNVTVWVGGDKMEMGVHEGLVHGVRVLFLHNPLIFPKPYPPHDAYAQTRVMATFAKGTLELLCQWRLIPGLIVTNDWFTGLVPAYARNPKFFGSVFNRTDFLHIAHNLNPDYEGRLWPDRSQGKLEHLHELDSHLLVDPYWQDIVINPTRAALLCSDSWATVSRSYRGELLSGSPLRPLLRLAPHPFAHPNGIPVKARQGRLNSLPTKTHEEAKAVLQRKYFNMTHPDLSVPLFAFVGRITLQKGVHLILESIDALLTASAGRAQFLVGGMASESDSYGRHCAGMMADLRARHPDTFWADPNLFFTDGDLVNLGADFCLMPSVFEPGGIVQQEFFVAGTPVIAFKTGGLKDTVLEWQSEISEYSVLSLVSCFPLPSSHNVCSTCAY